MHAMAMTALKSLPEPFLSLTARVIIRVEEFADEETLEALFIDDPIALTGIYSGVAMTIDLHSEPALEPPIVWLYRTPILHEHAQRGDVSVEELVAHVLIHELGHHFGWSDSEMDAALRED